MNDTALELVQSNIPEKWQQMLADLITDPKELLEILKLDPNTNPLGLAGIDQFPLRAPRPFVDRIEPGNWHDPLLRQIWPAAAETHQDAALNRDPLQESRFNPAPGLLQKYHGRALLSAAPHCAIHCRYCFRRHFDYAGNSPSRRQWQQSLSLLQADESLREVILSGGDPLAASDRQLDWLLDQLERISHLTTLRIHTRLPVVIPQRITAKLVTRLQQSRLQKVMVLHVNHARELDSAVAQAIARISSNNFTLLNQSVLLRDVNDTAETLAELSETLFRHGVLPYYLHMPDAVAGTRHFQIDETRARAIVADLRARLPGYLVPTLVREIPGADSKTPLL